MRLMRIGLFEVRAKIILRRINPDISENVLIVENVGAALAPKYSSRNNRSKWTSERTAFLWAELLGVQRVGRNDHFCNLGGHSLLAIRLVSRIKRDLDAELPLGDVFETPDLP